MVHAENRLEEYVNGTYIVPTYFIPCIVHFVDAVDKSMASHLRGRTIAAVGLQL